MGLDLLLLTGPPFLWLMTTSLVLLRNVRQFRRLPRHATPSSTRVSVCIPARNEEAGIGACVASLLDQTHGQLEILVLDDASSDGTRAILQGMPSPRLRVIDGAPKPDDWLGKHWACAQLAAQADGELLLFADADTWFSAEAVANLAAHMDAHPEDGLLTAWPVQQLGSWSERLIVPMVYHALLTLLPVSYVSRDPRWMPRPLRPLFRPLFAAACGQFMAFRRETYDAVGGHAAVKGAIVDDVELAKAVRRVGGRVRMVHGAGTVGCRMYRDHREVYNGFRKNFLAGFGGNIPLFATAALMHVWVHFVPLAGFVSGSVPASVFAVLFAIPVAQRAVIARWFGWPLADSVSHLAGVLWFQMLGVRVLLDRLIRRKIEWKGRPV
jgi:chlorobactene glucosyltransferase